MILVSDTRIAQNMAAQAERWQSLLQRIEAGCELDPLTGCLVWQGATSGDGRGGGYGRIKVNNRTCATHKVIYTLYGGFIPGNMTVDHVCQNRLCCNVGHLELVTNKENNRRRALVAKAKSDPLISAGPGLDTFFDDHA